jgi:hypothetical protein
VFIRFKVVGSEIVEVHAVAEHVVGDDEDAVSDGDPGSFRSPALADASELRTQITLARVGCCPGALQKHLPTRESLSSNRGVLRLQALDHNRADS